MFTALVVTDLRSPGDASDLSSASMKVFNPVPSNDGVLRIALACMGIGNPSIVRESSVATVSYTTQPKSYVEDRTHKQFPGPIDAKLLMALEPRAKIAVGSLRQILPDTRWFKADGASVMLFPSDRVHVMNVVSKIERPWPVNRVRPSQRPAHVRVPQSARIDERPEVPDVFRRGHSRVSKRVSSLGNVRLREGDSFVDREGTRWFYVGGLLTDRLPVTLLKADFVVAGGAITPRQPSSARPQNYVPNTSYEVRLVDRTDQSKHETYPCSSFDDGIAAWGWKIDGVANSDPDRYVCVHADGTIEKGTDETKCRNAGGVWDRPCANDSECPYNDPRRARGGCTKSGYCEFPLETSSLSYRVATEPRVRLRHGCSQNDSDFPRCSNMRKENARFHLET